LSKKGRIYLPLLVGTLILLAVVTAAERALHRNTHESTAHEDGVEQ